jgi:hypothetical protein
LLKLNEQLSIRHAIDRRESFAEMEGINCNMLLYGLRPVWFTR